MLPTTMDFGTWGALPLTIVSCLKNSPRKHYNIPARFLPIAHSVSGNRDITAGVTAAKGMLPLGRIQLSDRRRYAVASSWKAKTERLKCSRKPSRRFHSQLASVDQPNAGNLAAQTLRSEHRRSLDGFGAVFPDSGPRF